MVFPGVAVALNRRVRATHEDQVPPD
jgi:hypothetical protein